MWTWHQQRPCLRASRMCASAHATLHDRDECMPTSRGYKEEYLIPPATRKNTKTHFWLFGVLNCSASHLHCSGRPKTCRMLSAACMQYCPVHATSLGMQVRRATSGNIKAASTAHTRPASKLDHCASQQMNTTGHTASSTPSSAPICRGRVHATLTTITSVCLKR